MIHPTRPASFGALSTLVLCAAFSPEVLAQCEEEARLTASDGAGGDLFGSSVSLSGDTALVGALLENGGGLSDSGSAYVFVRSGTSWSEQAKLIASDVAAIDQFGTSVSLSGDTALVGAPLDDDSGSNSGAAYVFVRDGTSWSEQAKLIAGDGDAGDRFGSTVFVSGDTVLVGATYDGPAFSAGAAYVFVRTGTVWSEQARLTASDVGGGKRFGSGLALAGDQALIGSNGDSVGAPLTGSVYVFGRNGTIWSEQAKLTTSDASEEDRLGFSISVAGDTALFGVTRDDDGGADSGSVYVFARNGTAWSEQTKLTASDASAGDGFGSGVSFSGDTAVIGALFGDGEVVDSGAAYVFVRNGTSWSERTTLSASDGASGDRFGGSVSVSDGMVLISASWDDDAGSESGSAYVLDLTPPGIGATYCATSPNSVGAGMLISATGMLSLARECVTLRADGGPENKFGLFFFGPNQLAGTPFGEGLRCVGGVTRRIQPPAATGPANGSPSGTAIRALDFDLPYGAALSAAPPSTNFQYWYRDPMGGPAGFNTSDAVEIGFVP